MDDTPSSWYDSIRCRIISTDTIPIQFAYLIAYFVRPNDDGGGHRRTELTPRHRRDRCRERKKRACAKRRIAGRYRERPRHVGCGHDELFYTAGAPLPHRRSRYRKLRALTALRSHVRIRIRAPCPRRTSGLISRRHVGLHRPPPAAPWHSTASSARYKVS